jgi:RNA polymerase-binding transcription factor DksA
MAKFLTTTGVSHHLDQLIKGAKQKLVLISPFLKINKQLKQALEDNDRMKIDIRIVYGKNELQPEENNWLKGLVSVRSSFCENLHAKCYLNEKEAIVTSMNLYEFSQQNNHEMGILVTRDEDPELYNQIYEEAGRLIRFSDEIRVSVEKVKPASESVEKQKSSIPKIELVTTSSGHCIRCNGDIPFKLEAPYCRKCWSSWSKVDRKDEKHPEKFCHLCGKDAKTAFEKPKCYSCYKSNA